MPVLKRLLILNAFLFFGFQIFGQSIMGSWYGVASPKATSSTNNYLVELIITTQQGNRVSGLLSYYFKNTYRNVPVSGLYYKNSRQLVFNNVPIFYHGSIMDIEVDCTMSFFAKLQVNSFQSILKGELINSIPENRLTCIDINFSLAKSKEKMNMDSIHRLIKLTKENTQKWFPEEEEEKITKTIVPIKIAKEIDKPKIEQAFIERINNTQQIIDVYNDTIQVDFYDNGEVDNDSISVFFNKKIIAGNQKLSIKKIHFDLLIDPALPEQEITMFANNLGRYPPNTALMIITDGEKRYRISLSSNLEKNATVILRKKNR